MSHVYLIAPRDLQYEPFYERVLELLREEHGPEGVKADRALFDDNADYRRRGREVYKDASLVYAICHPDMTVGLGLYKQLSRARDDKVPRRVLPVDRQTLSPIEDFKLEKTNLKNLDGADNIFKFAFVRPMPTVRTTA